MDFLIEPQELRRGDGGALVIDARRADAYTRGHIPGAVHLTTYDIFVPGTRPAELAAFRTDLAQRYAAVGVTKERPVVVYEDDTGMRAARELWILEYLGHRNARMLHGGVKGWIAAGGALDGAEASPVPASFDADEVTQAAISADEVLAMGRAGTIRILDVRDAVEFAGKDHTACCARRGRVPGAVWLEWSELLDPASGRFRSREEIRAALSVRGVDPGATLVPYCHRGARSANTYYALRHAGCASVRNYIGSFHDWSARSDLPVEA